MDTSVFAFIMALIWGSIFILLATLLMRKTNYVYQYGVNFIILILILGIARFLLSFEPNSAIVIQSTRIMPMIQHFLQASAFQVAGISFKRSHILFGIWLIGSFIYLVKIGMELVKMNSWLRKISSVDHPQIEKVMAEIVSASKPRQNYRILVSEEVGSPMMVGYFTPTIVMPPLDLSDQELHYVLLHEWSHFLHKHIWIKLFFRAFCGFLWWNPLVYSMRNDLNNILEINCDRLVVSGLQESEHIQYVEASLHVMKQLVVLKRQEPVGAIAFMSAGCSGKMLQRSKLVLYPPPKVKTYLKHTFVICALALFLSSYSFILQPWTEPMDWSLMEAALIPSLPMIWGANHIRV